MSDVKWTSEQKQAIEEKGQNILVAAAAGSGKTAVLVERIIQKIIIKGNIIRRLITVFAGVNRIIGSRDGCRNILKLVLYFLMHNPVKTQGTNN